MITIKDIAVEAGVSKTTVSRVLNHSGKVSENTRKRVQKVIDKYDYQPSESARALIQQTTKMIGVVIPNVYNDFYNEVLQGITQVADEKNMSLIFCNTNENPNKEEKALSMLKGQRVRGVIMALASDNPDRELRTRVEEQIAELNAPVVFIDRTLPLPNDSVIFDGFGAVYRATEELIKAGNKKIGIITGDISLKIGKDRLDGFLQAMKDYKLPINKSYIYYGNFLVDRAYELSSKMYDSGDYPEAIITSNNDTTIGFLRATRERSIELGREIAMIGIDHITILDTIGYKYSHIARDFVGTGIKAMQLLFNKIEKPYSKPKKVVMPFTVNLMGTEKRRKK